MSLQDWEIKWIVVIIYSELIFLSDWTPLNIFRCPINRQIHPGTVKNISSTAAVAAMLRLFVEGSELIKLLGFLPMPIANYIAKNKNK